jgi:regulator of protease activity HflC (stomatin/prohibitin superfamily)
MQNQQQDETTRKVRLGIRIGLICILGLFVLITGWKSFTIISSGTVGVSSTFGKVAPEELEAGVHPLIPWVNSVKKLNTQLKTFTIENAEASSKDLQRVTTKITLQHSLLSSLAAETYCEVGDIDVVDANVVGPAVHECLKAVTAQYTAEELITKRDVVKQKVVEAITNFINDTLEDRGIKGACPIANVAITDFKFSDQFNASIEAKVLASQLALKAVNEKTKKITEAESTKIEREKEADGEAYRIEQESIARAGAIKREAEALANNPTLVRLRAIERWNGKLPIYNSGQSPVPFVSVGNVEPIEQDTSINKNAE